MRSAGWHVLRAVEHLDAEGNTVGEITGQQDTEDEPGSRWTSEMEMFAKMAAGWEPWGLLEREGSPGERMRLFYFKRPRN